ncbi:MAG TPA: hypothetical protein VK568_14850 [Thermodesulfobacteriota bacterium]|nr:hypothetical protein [Thermodesulfobacteriota bacterium]
MQPIPRRRDGMDGTARRRTVHHAATTVTTNMMGVSISSAILVPKRGAAHRVRIDPSTKPAPKTITK